MSTDYIININAQDNASKQINRIQGGLGGLTAGAGRFKAALGLAAGAFAAIGVGSVVTDTINSFDDLAKSARLAGATASNEAFQGFQVLKQAMNEAGIDAATFDRAMLQTTSRLQKGIEGQKSFAEITDKLGSSIRNANGELKSGPELLQAMINALNEGTISTDEFAKVVGGRAGPLIQQQFGSINDSADKLAATLADVEANSNIVSLDAAQNAEVFNDNIGRLKEGLGQLLTDAITPLLPHLVRLSEEILAGMPQYIETAKNWFDKLRPAIELIGTVLTDLVLPVMGSLFEALGNIAEAITPLVEASLPYLKEGFDLVSEGVQWLFDKMTPMIEKALPAIKQGFDLLSEAAQWVYDKLQPLIDASLPTITKLFDGVTSALGWVFDKMKIVYETAIPALKAGFDGIVAIVQSVVEWFNSAAAAIQRIYDKAISLKNGVTGAFSSASESVTNATKDMYNGATNWANQMYNEWWGNSIFPDLRDNIIRSFQDMAMGAINNTQMMSQNSTSIANNMMHQMQGIIGQQMQGLLGNLGNQLGSMQGLFQSTFQNVIGRAQSAFSQLSPIFSGIGKGLGGLFGAGGFGGGLFSGVKNAFGGLFGGVKKLFGGFFANGGYLPSGKFGIAGEAGPEIITGPARVTPMQAGGGMPGPTVNFNINAIDPSTGTQFILDHKNEITSIIQSAYNKRGRTGIY